MRIYRNVGSLRSIYIAAQGKEPVPPPVTVSLYIVQAFGRNDSAQLGVGYTSPYTNPVVTIPTDAFTEITDGIIDVSSGYGNACVIDSTGNLWYVGDYPIGLGGSYEIPQMSNITNVKKNAVDHQGMGTLMLKEDGSVWYVGAQGDGNERAGVVAATDDIETQIPNLADAVQVKMGSYGCLALLANGDLYSWASNYAGQGGNGDTSGSSIPVPTLILSGVKEIVSGNDGYFALKTNGDLYGWGLNQYGVTGLPYNDIDWNIYVPTLTATNVKQVSMGEGHALYMAIDGKVYGTGGIEKGQLGIGIITIPDGEKENPSQDCYYHWILTGFPTDLDGISAGNERSYGWKGNTIYACGDYGKYGALGDGRAWTAPFNAEPNVINYTVSKPVARIVSENTNGTTYVLYNK